MPFCFNCGKQLVDGAKFCFECGAKIKAPKTTHDEMRQTVYDGEIHKCPNCGDIIDPYEIVCEACGFEIRGRKTSSVVHDLFLKIEMTDDAEKKDELIRTFYIPNTKEDILEFFILALSNIKIGGSNTKAWMVKLEQAYQKAKLSFGGTQGFEKICGLYEEAQIANKKNSSKSMLKAISKCFRSGYAWALLLGLCGVIFLLMNISFDIELLNVIGGGAIYVAVMIAMITTGMRHKDD